MKNKVQYTLRCGPLSLFCAKNTMDTDEIDPPRPRGKPLNLQEMSVGELQAYIGTLESEIERAKRCIADKQNHRQDIESLFADNRSTEF